jgi:hypothetical protein
MCRKRCFLWVALASIPLFVSIPAQGGYSSWTSQGPDGGHVSGQAGIVGRQEPACLPHALCVSGKVRHRTEVLVRVDGPQREGTLAVSIARFTRARVEVWVERPATGDRRYYRLEAVPADRAGTPGVIDPSAFREP